MDTVLIGEILAVTLFCAIIFVLMLGYPVAFTLPGTALIFALTGWAFGAFDLTYLNSLPLRYWGIITNDVLIAFSNSGETAELLAMVPPVRRLGAKLIAVTGNSGSTLARLADAHLDAGVAKEACPMNLAPTASTTAQLAMGDALAVALLHTKGFGPLDFARSHPGGNLGRKLLTRVRDVMRQGDAMPVVPRSATLTDALLEVTRKRMGMTAIVDADGVIAGIFTDGDLRRALERITDLRGARVADVMTASPRSISPDALATEAVHSMETHGISQLLVVGVDGRLTGALNLQDLFQAKVV